MIRPLRQRHRHIVIALGIVLPVMFAVGIAARKPVPVVTELPAALAASTQKFEATIWERGDLFTNAPIKVRLLREQKGGGQSGLEFSAAKDFIKPDLIVYWVVGKPNLTEALPADAVLLGSFGTTFPLPEEATRSAGVLILFSLADNEMVDVSKAIQFSEPSQ